MKIMRPLLIIQLIFSLAFTTTITGKITDKNSNEPLIGANVFILNSDFGSATDMDGTYTIDVPDYFVGDNYQISVSYIGYRPLEQSITISNGENKLSFLVEKDVLGFSEVVVAGMVGEREKATTPLSISTISKDQVELATPTSAEGAIRGKVAGAKIVSGSGQPGKAASIQLRGATSINSTGRSQNPLYIVDGVILSEDASMSDIDASDIESIEVVKGAAGTSLYGARAAQGVVQITTSRGKDLAYNKTHIKFKTEMGFNELPNKIKMVQNHHYKVAEGSYTDENGIEVSAGDYIDENGNWLDPRDPQAARVLDDYITTVYPDSSSGIYFQDNEYKYVETGVPGSGAPTLLNDGGFDHLDRFFNPGQYQVSTVSIGHNTANTNFFTSFRTTKEPGVLHNLKGYNRNSLRVNLDHSLAERLEFSSSTYVSQSESDEVLEDSGSPFFGLTFIPPSVDLLAVDTENYEQEELGGTWSPIYDQIFVRPDPMNPMGSNPIYNLLYQDRNRIRNRFLSNVSLSYVPLSWLSVQANLSIDRSDNQFIEYLPRDYKTPFGASGNGLVYQYRSNSQATNGDLTASFSHDLEELSLRAKLRYLFENDKFEDLTASGNNLAVVDVPSLDVATEGQDVGSSKTEISSEGYYFIGGADYQEKYITDILLRRDGSSLFGSNERWQNYYRTSFAWRISEEEFWPVKDIVDEFKLRFSQGTAGNRPDFVAQYETYSVSGGVISKETLGNKDLKPEFSTESEFGVDFSLYNRFLVQLTYANSTIEDQILLVPLPGYLGYSYQWQNAGTLSSNTFEFSLNGVLAEGNNYSWTGNFLFDKTKQKITEFNLPAYTWAPEGSQGMNVFINQADEELGTLYGYKFITERSDLPSFVDQSQFEQNDDGYIVWVGDGNSYQDGISQTLWGSSGTLYSTDSTSSQSFDWGIPIIYTEDDGNQFVNIGSTIPDFNYSFSSNFNYGNWTLYALFEGQSGGQIYNMTRQWGMRDHKSAEVDQADKSEGDMKPTVYYDKLYNVRQPTSHFVEDGTYLKLQELAIRYKTNLSMVGFDNNFTVGFVGRNLLTFSKYQGYDPDVGVSGGEGGSAVITRFDGYSYPNFSTYSLVFEIEF